MGTKLWSQGHFRVTAVDNKCGKFHHLNVVNSAITKVWSKAVIVKQQCQPISIHRLKTLQGTTHQQFYRMSVINCSSLCTNYIILDNHQLSSIAISIHFWEQDPLIKCITFLNKTVKLRRPCCQIDNYYVIIYYLTVLCLKTQVLDMEPQILRLEPLFAPS